MTANKQPNSRFIGFKEPWKVESLDKNVFWASGGTPSKNMPSYWIGSIPWITASEMHGYKYDDSKLKISSEGLSNGSKMAEVGDLLLLVRGSMLFNRIPVGIVTSRLSFNQDVKAIKCKSNIFPRFLLSWFQAKEHLLLNMVVGTGIGAGKLDLQDLKSMKVALPSLFEQQKIAAFLTAVDDKIQQLNKKKALLEQYKKGVMQQIFNQEIRFKDEAGTDYPNWVIVKLNQIVLKFIVPMRDKPTDLTGNIPWCRIEDFNGKYLSSSKSGQGVNQETVKKMNLKVYPVNSLIVSCSANLGFSAIIKEPLITNQTFIGLVPDPSLVNVEFLYYVMKLSSRQLNVLASGTTISYLSRQQFESFPINIPSVVEQLKIANFLSAIDDKINNVTQQLEQTKQYKKGLLQQMFV